MPTVLVTVLFGLIGLVPALMAADRSRRTGHPAGRIWAAFVGSLVVAAGVQAALAFFVILPLEPFARFTDSTPASSPVAAETSAPSDPVPTSSEPAAPPTTEAATRTPATFPPGATICPALGGSVGGFTHSAAGSDVTSCPFAESVRTAYGSQPVRGRAVTIQAYSPVTERTYSMICSGSELVTCMGGTNAIVYLIG